MNFLNPSQKKRAIGFSDKIGSIKLPLVAEGLWTTGNDIKNGSVSEDYRLIRRLYNDERTYRRRAFAGTAGVKDGLNVGCRQSPAVNTQLVHLAQKAVGDVLRASSDH